MTDAERTLLLMVAQRLVASVRRDAELLAAIKAVEDERITLTALQGYAATFNKDNGL